MIDSKDRGFSRRTFLVAGGGFALTAQVPAWSAGVGSGVVEYRIAAQLARVPLVGGSYRDTEVWAYDGRVPGPEFRVRQGERLRVILENRLKEDTTIHWHGVRVPNAMDGVPHLTQKPIAPGETFTYEFDVPDAGTFWYHPHVRSFEQVGRGLYAALIVEEREPLPVDRDLTWVLDDWRLTGNAEIAGDFGNMMDVSMAGRIGNTVTINGRIPRTFGVRAGERLRLRLINAANARIFGVQFQGHQPKVVALDGQPVEPHPPANEQVVLGPGQRADLVIDMTGAPGEIFTVLDTFFWQSRYKLVDLVYGPEPLRGRPPDDPIRLPDNPLADPDLSRAERHDIVFGGGMMGGGTMGGGTMGGMMGGMTMGNIWTINGESAAGDIHEPLLTLKRDRSYVFAMHNNTAFHHTIHLHGQSFRVLSRNGRATRHKEWLDTVLTAPNERMEIAFVADNPGDWMFHCHILEHAAGGMMGMVRI
ncbi:MAG: multicopper oxidase family protein [Pseudomonadota bacterium]